MWNIYSRDPISQRESVSEDLPSLIIGSQDLTSTDSSKSSHEHVDTSPIVWATHQGMPPHPPRVFIHIVAINETPITGISFRSQPSSSTLDVITLSTKRTIENESFDILDFPTIHKNLFGFWTPRNTIWSFEDVNAIHLSMNDLSIKEDIGSIMMNRAESGYSLDVSLSLILFKTSLYGSLQKISRYWEMNSCNIYGDISWTLR